MDESVSVSRANRNFSRLLRGTHEGRSYVVTAHGRPVAKLIPVRAATAASGAQRALFCRLRCQPATDIGRWSRDELYEDER